MIKSLVSDLKLDPQLPLTDQLSAATGTDPARLQLLGVALLQLFVQVNWTGCPPQIDDSFASLASAAAEEILVEDSGGDALMPVAQFPGLLAAAKIILVDNKTDSDNRPLLSLLWALRCCLTVQDVLEEKSDRLHASIAALVAEGRTLAAAEGAAKSNVAGDKLSAAAEDKLSAAVEDKLSAAAENKLSAHAAADDKLLVALFHLEAARCHSLYHEVREMVSATQEAARCVGLTVKDTGALGRRTKHQVL